MTEVNITVRASFADEKQAKEVTKQLKSAAKKYDCELTKTIHSLYSIEDYEIYNELHIEKISCKKNNLTILAYTGRTDPVVWFAPSLYSLGASKIYIREQWDEGGSNYYFLNGKKVSKKTYDGEKKKKLLSEKDIEINQGLFLPAGRVMVKATLIAHWSVDDMYENICMEFVTEDGMPFYYKGTGSLTELTLDNSPKTCEFNAAFERGKLDGEYVAYAKRPTKIKIGGH